MKQVLVVGAGISGLVTAYRLRRAEGLALRVLERSDRPGGRVRSMELAGGFVADSADFLVANYAHTLRLVREIDVPDALVEIDPKAFFSLYRDGRIWPLSPTALGFLASRALRPREKIDMVRFFATVMLRHRRGAFLRPSLLMQYDDVRLSDYLRARFAPGTLDVLLDPMVRMTGASAAKLSLASLFSLAPAAFERHYAFAKGNGVFPKRLAELCPPIETGRSVQRIVIEGGQVRGVVLDDGERIAADVVVCATDARVAATLLRDLREAVLRPLTDVEYSHRLDVLIGIERRFLESWALVVPQSVGSFITYLIDETVKSPRRAPEGRGLLKAMISGEPARRVRSLSDDAIVGHVMAEIQRLLPGSPKEVLCARVVRHSEIIPMLRPGYLKALACLNEGVREIDGLELIGDYQSNGTIEGCVYEAEQAATRILEAL